MEVIGAIIVLTGVFTVIGPFIGVLFYYDEDGIPKKYKDL